MRKPQPPTLSAVTGARRGETVAPQWCDFDLDRGVVRIDENYAQDTEGLYVKDPKDHQVRFVSLDKVTIDLVRKYKAACARQLLALGFRVRGITVSRMMFRETSAMISARSSKW